MARSPYAKLTAFNQPLLPDPNTDGDDEDEEMHSRNGFETTFEGRPSSNPFVLSLY